MKKNEKNWYVVNTYVGHEEKVQSNLLKRVETLDMQDYIFKVIIAWHAAPVMKDGKPTNKTKKKNTYPGYLFVEMIMSDRAWYVVRNTPGVTGFIGSSGRGAKPFPVPKEQIESVLKSVGEIDEADVFSNYEEGDHVVILNGSLKGSDGVVSSVDKKRQVVKVDVMFFGRKSSVEVKFSDINKVNE